MREIFEVRIPDGEVLKGYCWKAENAVCSLNISTGMNEHSLRYEAFAEWLNEHGVTVRALDHIGQGLNVSSVDELQIWPKDAFAKNVDGIRAMCLYAKEDGLPVAVLGHSMGSFMIQSLLIRYPETADKVILMGSNGGQGALMRFAKTIARFAVRPSNRDLPNHFLTVMSFGPYVRAVKDATSKLDWLSYNKENIKEYKKDPYCGHPDTGGFWKEFFIGMSHLWDRAQMKKVSKEEDIFLVSGRDDPVGQMGKGVEWLEKTYKKLGVKKVRMKLYDHMRHEILMEDERELVYNDIYGFLTSSAQNSRGE